MNFGQTCHAGTRIYVHEDVYDEFINAYTERFKKVRVGDNFDGEVDQGPQNSKMQYEKILGYIQAGKDEGATLHMGKSSTPSTVLSNLAYEQTEANGTASVNSCWRSPSPCSRSFCLPSRSQFSIRCLTYHRWQCT